ncbi:hypothetical protein CRUP_009962 [Coryphaenoides rupestris]|nr:hypothetical protein CRUP_009962 [Coryphaenoides rupestris]
MVLLRLPDGSAAADVPIEIQVLGMAPVEVTTNQEGEALHLITPTASDAQIVVKVKADNKEQEKVIKRMLSPSQHYLYVSAPSGKLKVGRQFRASFQIIGGVPQDGFVYFLVLSRGELVQQGSLHVAVNGGFKFIQTTAQMMPSCRLIGYYYDQNGVVVSGFRNVNCNNSESKQKGQDYKTRQLDTRVSDQDYKTRQLDTRGSDQDYKTRQLDTRGSDRV